MKKILKFIFFISIVGIQSCSKDYGTCSCKRSWWNAGNGSNYGSEMKTIELEKNQECEDLNYGNHEGSMSCEEV
jgi:hypothetical protein